MMPSVPVTLRAAALAALAETDIAAKLAATLSIDDVGPLDALTALTPPPQLPGRPAQPLLVSPRDVPQRSISAMEGRAALIHSIAHIEFNAINLALDIIWRFAGMPDAFYRDWLRVAKEEAKHFQLLRSHLQTLGHDYGDYLAHNGLWDMAEKTRDDLLARIALVPRTLEARGLDVTPGIRSKLAQAGDHAAAAVLDIILREEIGHVSIGNYWYRWVCAQRGLDPVTTYDQLAQQYGAPALRGPFNIEARRQAGFVEEELKEMSMWR